MVKLRLVGKRRRRNLLLQFRWDTYYTSPTFENLYGSYTVYVATVGDNCEATYNVTIGASSPFTATATASSAVCLEHRLQLQQRVVLPMNGMTERH